MASKEMAYFNVGNDEFEIVDEAGRQATSTVDEKVDAVDEKVDGLTAENIHYNNSESGLIADDVQEAIDETVNSLTTKIDYLDLEDVGGGSATDALGKAWDAITTYNKPVVVKYIYNGIWMGMAYKYSGNLYGMMQSMPYHTGNIYLLNVNNGAKTFKTLTGQ